MPRKIDIPAPLGFGKLNVDGLDELEADGVHAWHLLRTKGRQEQAIARDLTDWQVPYFLPVVELRRSRQKSIVEPMFPGYMFLYGTVADRYLSLKTKRIAQVVDINDQKLILNELIAIESTMNCGYDIRVVAKLCKGDLCQIRRGPLGGVCGTVELVSDDNYWVAMYVKTLGQSILTKVPRADVQLEVSKEVVHGPARRQNDQWEAA